MAKQTVKKAGKKPLAPKRLYKKRPLEGLVESPDYLRAEDLDGVRDVAGATGESDAANTPRPGDMVATLVGAERGRAVTAAARDLQLIDELIDKVEQEGSTNVYFIVGALRLQRSKLIQDSDVYQEAVWRVAAQLPLDGSQWEVSRIGEGPEKSLRDIIRDIASRGDGAIADAMREAPTRKARTQPERARRVKATSGPKTRPRLPKWWMELRPSARRHYAANHPGSPLAKTVGLRTGNLKPVWLADSPVARAA